MLVSPEITESIHLQIVGDEILISELQVFWPYITSSNTEIDILFDKTLCVLLLHYSTYCTNERI